MRGFTNLVVCKLGPGPTPDPNPVPDAAKPSIRMSFVAPFARTRGETMHFQGRFRIGEGTQRYAGLTGSGTISGYLFCLAPEGAAASASIERGLGPREVNELAVAAEEDVEGPARCGEGSSLAV